MTDYALQMAYGNFSAALMHVGGQNVYYNVSRSSRVLDFADLAILLLLSPCDYTHCPVISQTCAFLLALLTLRARSQPFTPPPGNLSSTHEWTTGSVYYAVLVVAETFGQSNVSRITDLSNNTDQSHPVYAIYENDVATRIVGFNFVSDPSGANNYALTLNGLSQGQVFVRYLLAPSVSEQYNITWANQTLGMSFASDGRMHGGVETTTINCANGACVIPIPAPAIALVFLNQVSLTNSTPASTATTTFATTIIGTGSLTVNPEALKTSNGQNSGSLGSTSNQAVAKSAGRRRLGVQLSLNSVGVNVVLGMVMVAVRTLC